MRILPIQSLSLVLASVHLVAADDSVWKTKPAAEWTEEDAKQVLDKSPWARKIRAVITRRLTEDQLREGGQMGQPRGVGNDGVDSSRSLPQSITLRLRWESALPIRLAELKSRELEPPTLEGDGYRIAVYGIPSGDFKGTPPSWVNP